MKRTFPKPAAPARPRQQLPAELVGDLMWAIRHSFYGDLAEKQWVQDQEFIRRKVVCYPAGWLVSRGVTLPTERYKAIFMEVLTTIKHHGQTGVVKYWPGYLLHCLQMHFKCHGDEYYEEAKSVRAACDQALARAESAGARRVDAIEVLAALKSVAGPGRSKARQVKTKEQMSLFQMP